MTRIGLLSDTHSYLDPKVFNYFEECHEVWHAGDIGSIEIIDQLNQFKKTRIVYGNIDGHLVRSAVSENEIFQLEDHKVFITHIAGAFESYNSKVKAMIHQEKPSILVCGHSHVLKIAFDKKHQMLYLNPGACGKFGFHNVRTMIRFTVEKKDIRDMEIIELTPR